METVEYITTPGLEGTLKRFNGNALFRKALEQDLFPRELVQLLANYIEFNKPSGAGILTLAGLIASRTDIFKDREVPEIIADRSYEVADGIFFAAVGEFAAGHGQKNHRALAQDLLKEMTGYFHLNLGTLSHGDKIYPSTREAVQKVKEGYGIGMHFDDPSLFKSLGFEVASERLAGGDAEKAEGEFRILDAFLRSEHRNLVDYLEDTGAYRWISYHLSLEPEHRDSVIISVNKGLNYYSGNHGTTKMQMQEKVMEGIAEFALVHENFMKGLLEDH